MGLFTPDFTVHVIGSREEAPGVVKLTNPVHERTWNQFDKRVYELRERQV